MYISQASKTLASSFSAVFYLPRSDNAHLEQSEKFHFLEIDEF